MRAFVLAILSAVLLGACAVEDPATRPDTFLPPDPKTRGVAYVEITRDVGVLGAVSLRAVDDLWVLNPAYLSENRVPEAYRRGTRTRNWSDGSETLFVAVPVGTHRLAYWFLPGVQMRDLNIFDPGNTIVPAVIEADLRPNRYYRACGEETSVRRSYRLWLTDIDTGRTVASMLVQ